MLELTEINLDKLPNTSDYYFRAYKEQLGRINYYISRDSNTTKHSICWDFEVYPEVHSAMQAAGWIRIKSKDINTYVPAWFLDCNTAIEKSAKNTDIAPARDFYEKTLIAQLNKINEYIRGAKIGIKSVLELPFVVCPELVMKMKLRGWKCKEHSQKTEIYPVWFENLDANPEEYMASNEFDLAEDFYKATLKNQVQEILRANVQKKLLKLESEAYPLLIEKMQKKAGSTNRY